MKRLLALVFSIFCLTAAAQTVSNFSAINVQDGATISLSDYKSFPGVVIIFTSNVCAFDEYYTSRFSKLIEDYNPKIPVLLVNPHPGVDENISKMKARMVLLGISVPYLADKDQLIMQQLKATRSPEAFLLQRSGDKFAVIYRGAIDDNPQVQTDVREHYMANALDALMDGRKPAIQEVRPMGCIIRKK